MVVFVVVLMCSTYFLQVSCHGLVVLTVLVVLVVLVILVKLEVLVILVVAL